MLSTGYGFCMTHSTLLVNGALCLTLTHGPICPSGLPFPRRITSPLKTFRASFLLPTSVPSSSVWIPRFHNQTQSCQLKLFSKAPSRHLPSSWCHLHPGPCALCSRPVILPLRRSPRRMLIFLLSAHQNSASVLR